MATTTPRPKKPQRALAVRLFRYQFCCWAEAFCIPRVTSISCRLLHIPDTGLDERAVCGLSFVFFKACPVAASSVQLLSLWFAPKQLEYIHNDLFFLTAAMISQILTNFCETVMIECRNGLINDSFSHFGYSESVSRGSVGRAGRLVVWSLSQTMALHAAEECAW